MHWQPPRVSPAQRGIRTKQLILAEQEAPKSCIGASGSWLGEARLEWGDYDSFYLSMGGVYT
jgi:hypothetical protein